MDSKEVREKYARMRNIRTRNDSLQIEIFKNQQEYQKLKKLLGEYYGFKAYGLKPGDRIIFTKYLTMRGGRYLKIRMEITGFGFIDFGNGDRMEELNSSPTINGLQVKANGETGVRHVFYMPKRVEEFGAWERDEDVES